MVTFGDGEDQTDYIVIGGDVAQAARRAVEGSFLVGDARPIRAMVRLGEALYSSVS